MHRVLERQIKRVLGSNTKIPTEEWALFKVISDTYQGFDEDRELLTRSLELSSKEFVENTRQLRESKEKVEIIVQERTKELESEKNKLAESKAKDEAILLSMGDGLVATDKNGIIILVNKAFEDLMGWSGAEVLGKEMGEVVPKVDKDNNLIPTKDRIFFRVLAGESFEKPTEGYYVRKNGTIFPVSSNVRPVKKDGITLGVVEVIRDITKEKELDQAKSDFISIASHQLRTPLAAIYWLVESLQSSFKQEELNEKQKSYIDDLNSATQRAVKLVEDLLNISRVQSGTFSVHREEIEVVEFIKKFIKDMQVFVKSRKRELVFEGKEEKAIKITLDPKIISTALQNLISNAVYNSTLNSTIRVNLEKTEDLVKVLVTNDGLGIPEDEKKHIFQKFYRGSNSRRTKTEGSGLGLFIVKSFIESVGGKVGFESVPNKETVFWFTIPLNK